MPEYNHGTSRGLMEVRSPIPLSFEKQRVNLLLSSPFAYFREIVDIFLKIVDTKEVETTGAIGHD